MKVLSIGNSFSVDATRYLHDAARAQGVGIYSANVQIGGCPLDKHYRNMLSGAPAYEYFVNGDPTGLCVSLEQMLSLDRWDVVTLQQVSQYAPFPETYEPYLAELAAYVRKFQPKAKLYLQETWAYEEGSYRLKTELGFANRAEMYGKVHAAYIAAKKDCGADGIIPSGTAMEIATSLGVEKVHRDTFHADLGIGRYMLALVWTGYLAKVDISQNKFRDFDVPASEEDVKKVIKAAALALEGAKD